MDFQSAMETFAEAWVAANSQSAPKLGGLTLSPSSNNNNVTSESNNNHGGHQGTDGRSQATEPTAVNSMDSGLYSQSQKCDTLMDSAATAIKNCSMTSPGKNSEDPHTRAKTPPAPTTRALSPPGIGMDLSPPNRRSRLSSSASPAALKRSSKPAPLTHAHTSSRQTSPCLGKSIPIHCIVEVLSAGTDSGKNGLLINNNNNWDFGKHNKSKEQSTLTLVSGTSGQDANSGESGAKSNAGESNLTPDEDKDKVKGEHGDGDHSGGSDEDSREHEQAADDHDFNSKSPSHAKLSFVTEVDDFVIIPSHTRFHDVVATVLALLGYTQASIRRASGTISLRNWKPLYLHQVCEPGDEDKTVGDIFNDLTHHAVLRIQIQDQRSKGGNLTAAAAAAAGVNSTRMMGMGTGSPEDLKEKLLRLLLRQSSSAVGRKDYANAQSQSHAHANEDADADADADADVDASGADEVAPATPSQHAKDEAAAAAPPWLLEDVNRRFDLWYASQHQHTIAGLVHSLLQQECQGRLAQQQDRSASASAHLSESSNESLHNDTHHGNGNHTHRKRRSSSSSWSSERERERERDRDDDGDGVRARDKETRQPRDQSSPAKHGHGTATNGIGNGSGTLLNGPLHQAAASLADKHSSLVDTQDKSKELLSGENSSASTIYRNSLQAIAAARQGIPSPSSLPATLPHEDHSPGTKMGLPLTMQDIINHRQSQSSQVTPTATPNFFLDECTNELLAAAAVAAAAAATGGRPHGHHGGPDAGLNHDFLRRGGSGPPDSSFSMHRQHQHPVFHNFASQKTRMRTSFDPEMELPKLQAWFQENPHPSRQQIQQYVRELNLLDCRKDRKPLDVNNVIYWFKNARAAQKRNEMRYNGLGTIQGTGASGGAGAAARQHQRSPLLSPFSSSMAAAAAFQQQQQQHGSPNDMLRRHYLDPRDGGDEDCSEEEEDFLQQQNTHNRSTSPLSKREQIKEEYNEGSVPVKVELSEGLAVVSSNERLTNGKRSESEPSPGAGEPKDLTNDKTSTHTKDRDRRRTSSTSAVDPLDDDRASNLSTSNSPTASFSPRSCSPVSPGRQYLYGRDRDDPLPNSSMSPPASASAAAAAAAAAMLNRFHPFFDHPSFLAYHRHLNSLHFGTGGGAGGGLGSGSPLENGPAQAQAAAYEQAVAAMALAQRNGKSQPPGSSIFDRRPGGGPERERGNPVDMFHDLPHNLLGNLRSPTMTRHNPYANLFGHPPTSASGGGSPPLPAHGGGAQSIRSSLISPPGRLGVSGPSAELISSIINSSARHGHGHGQGHEVSHPNHILGLPHPHQQQSPGTGGGGVGGVAGSHQQHHGHGHHHSRTSPTLALSSAALDERRKRNRTFIDPVTEVPRLEQWFTLNTHPSHNLILKYTDELNRMPYRQKFPRLEPKNVQFWFKNRRAKCKRLKMTM